MEKQYHLAKRDLKKEKYPEGALFYVIDHSDEYDEAYRIGSTGDMKKRKKIHDTHMLHKRDVVIIKETSKFLGGDNLSALSIISLITKFTGFVNSFLKLLLL